MFFEMYKAFVGVYNLLEVDGSGYYVCERIAFVVLLVDFIDSFDVVSGFKHYGGKYTSGKVATIGDKVYLAIKVGLQLFEALQYLGQMLVLKRFVYAHVVIAPTEVCGA